MALAQTNEAVRLIQLVRPNIKVEIIPFTTIGDLDQKSKLGRHGGKGGAFVEQIRQALRSGQIDAVMHSLKDMPGNEETNTLVIGAYLKREPPLDGLVIRPGLSIDEFRLHHGKGFKVGTNSVRRAAYMRRLFSEVEIIHYRGCRKDHNFAVFDP
jgi:hydroxymethylbilane synthase